jgi:integrase
MPFTDKQIAALKPKAGRYEKPEPGRTGLAIRVSPDGDKVWTFRYRLAGEQKRMVFGTYPKIGVAKAHIALADARDKLKRGIDPGALVAEERRAERDAETVSELVGEYLTHYARRFKKTSSADEDDRLLHREVIPEWGRRKGKDITRRDVIKLLDAIEARGAPVTRNRMASLLSKLFAVGLDRGLVDAHPAVGIRRLDEHPRDRVLTPEELRTFWHGLDEADMTPQTRAALRFALVTGQRRAEIAGTARDEIEDAEALWRLPAGRTKPGRDNLVPLPLLAMQLIEEADSLRIKPPPTRPNRKDRKPYTAEPSPWLFPSRIGQKPLEPAALSRALNRNRKVLGFDGNEPPTVHDLRRSFATYHGELGTAPEILGALLNHVPQTITGRVYNRAENIESRRAAMARWCQWLELVIAGRLVDARKMFGAEVVALNGSARHAG